MAGSEPDTSEEKLKAEITEQMRTIMKEMLVEFKRKERQERQKQLREERQERWERQEQPLAPPLRPFDLDADEMRQRLLEDDQEMILAEPAVRQRLKVPLPTLEETVIRPRAKIPIEAEKLDCAKDIVKAMAQI